MRAYVPTNVFALLSFLFLLFVKAAEHSALCATHSLDSEAQLPLVQGRLRADDDYLGFAPKALMFELGTGEQVLWAG